STTGISVGRFTDSVSRASSHWKTTAGGSNSHLPSLAPECSAVSMLVGVSCSVLSCLGE
ncbi:hypothetical protein AAF712_015193, partial [Marasmius tenuissimus]